MTNIISAAGDGRTCAWQEDQTSHGKKRCKDFCIELDIRFVVQAEGFHDAGDIWKMLESLWSWWPRAPKGQHSGLSQQLERLQRNKKAERTNISEESWEYSFLVARCQWDTCNGTKTMYRAYVLIVKHTKRLEMTENYVIFQVWELFPIDRKWF